MINACKKFSDVALQNPYDSRVVARYDVAKTAETVDRHIGAFTDAA